MSEWFQVYKEQTYYHKKQESRQMETMLESRPDPVTSPGIEGKSLDFSRSPSGEKVLNQFLRPFLVLETCNSSHYCSLWAHACN